MANTKPSPKSDSKSGGRTAAAGTSSSRGINPFVIIGGVVALVVVVFVVALVLTNGDDSSSPTGLTFAPGAEIREFQGVVVTGDPLPTAPDSGGDTGVGMAAPSLSGFGFDGTPIEITPGDGKPYMLVFLAHWCPHCNYEVPELVKWYESGEVPDDLRVVGIATGTDQNAPHYPPSQWLVDFGWPFEAMADSPQFVARNTYGLSAYPFMVLIDGDGKVLLRTSGEKPADVIDQLVKDTLGLSTDASTTEAPATEAPATEAPATEAP